MNIKGLWMKGVSLVKGLREEDLDPSPFSQFGAWFDDAKRSRIYLPEAMTLSTASPEGKPAARMVLLKGYDGRGFVFYTNYESRKAKELEANPYATLLFHWSTLERQIRIEGAVERVTEEESYAYFSSRARGSRLGAWASRQSSVLSNRAQLESQLREVENQYKGKDIPLPPFWGGYRVKPERMEFWQGRINRLHDRLCYQRAGEGWSVVRLSP